MVVAVARSRPAGTGTVRLARPTATPSSPVDGKCHHPVPGGQTVGPLTQAMDGAADLHPRYERPPGPVAGHAAPGKDVDEVQSRVLDPDGHLTRPGGRLGSFDEPDNFRTARLDDFDCSHGLLQSDHHGSTGGSPADRAVETTTPSPTRLAVAVAGAGWSAEISE